jgi:hypothetical protein
MNVRDYTLVGESQLVAFRDALEDVIETWATEWGGHSRPHVTNPIVASDLRGGSSCLAPGFESLARAIAPSAFVLIDACADRTLTQELFPMVKESPGRKTTGLLAPAVTRQAIDALVESISNRFGEIDDEMEYVDFSQALEVHSGFVAASAQLGMQGLITCVARAPGLSSGLLKADCFPPLADTINLRAAISSFSIPVALRLGAARISGRDLLEMRPGDVIELSAKIGETGELVAEGGRAFGRAVIGKIEGSLALQVLDPAH